MTAAVGTEADPASVALRSAVAKAGRRFIPLLLATYILNYLDRTCVGFAALTMNRDLGLSASQFGFGAGIFFLSYTLCELPSNAILHRVGARRWISRIMITWGLASAATALVTGAHSFYAVRLLLGVAEAGYFPGVIYFLCAWFPSQQRTRYVGLILLGIPISSVIGGPACGFLLQLNGALGLAGWKWLFLVLSLPCVVLGVASLRLLTDSPDKADWLTAAERQALTRALRSEVRERPKGAFWSSISDVRVLLLAVVQFGFVVGSYAIGAWLPLILKDFHLSDLMVGFVAAGPYAVAAVMMMIWAWRVDRRGGRIVNVAAACLLAAAGLAGAVWMHQSLMFSVIAITLALIGVNAARAIFWTIPPYFLVGAGAAGGLAFINSVGTAGGFVGPAAMGWLKDMTGSFNVGLGRLLLATSLLALSLKTLIRTD